MKCLNNFIERVGTDKIIHFLVGAVLESLMMPFGYTYVFLGVVFVYFISCIKETIDSYEEGNKCDWFDILASVFGAMVMCVYYCLLI